jgi:hypothetical protein
MWADGADQRLRVVSVAVEFDYDLLVAGRGVGGLDPASLVEINPPANFLAVVAAAD